MTEEADRCAREEQDRLLASLIIAQFAIWNSLFNASGIVVGILFDLGLIHRRGIGTRAIVSILAFSDPLRHIPTMKALLQAGLNGLFQIHPKSDHLSVTVVLSALAGHVLLHRILAGGKEVLL